MARDEDGWQTAGHRDTDERRTELSALCARAGLLQFYCVYAPLLCAA